MRLLQSSHYTIVRYASATLEVCLFWIFFFQKFVFSVINLGHISALIALQEFRFLMEDFASFARKRQLASFMSDVKAGMVLMVVFQALIYQGVTKRLIYRFKYKSFLTPLQGHT